MDEDVEAGSVDFFPQRLDQRRLVDHPAARDVDEDAALAERLEHLRVDHVVGLGATRHDRDERVDVLRHRDEVG